MVCLFVITSNEQIRSRFKVASAKRETEKDDLRMSIGTINSATRFDIRLI